MYEKQIKRTIFVAECECGYRDIMESRPPREKQCPDCKKWITYKQQEWTGKDRF